MKINNKIVAATSFNPTKKSHQMSITDMCRKIKENKITLPLYQRDLSWNLNKAVSLLNYQLFGKAPVAPISINQISDTSFIVPQVEFISRELISNELIKSDHQSVVDGQQRLSTNFKAYTNHEDFTNIVLDVSTASFKIITMSPRKYQIPVGILLNENPELLREYLKERNVLNDLFTILIEVRSKISNYNYTINIAENLSEDDQIEWFEVLNNAGSRVSALQMSFSRLKLHDYDIYSDYVEPFKNKLQDYGFEEIFSPFTTNVSYPTASLNPALEVILRNGMHSLNYAPIPSDTKEKQITTLELDDLLKITNLSLESLEEALEFLADNDLIDKVSRMDYILYLTGYFVFNKSKKLDEESTAKLIRWVNEVNFTNKSNGKRREIFNELIM